MERLSSCLLLSVMILVAAQAATGAHQQGHHANSAGRIGKPVNTEPRKPPTFPTSYEMQYNFILPYLRVVQTKGLRWVRSAEEPISASQASHDSAMWPSACVPHHTYLVLLGAQASGILSPLECQFFPRHQGELCGQEHLSGVKFSGLLGS